MKLAYIALFGMVGVFARYGTGVMVARYFPSPFPLATFWINVSGSFLIGITYILGVEKSALGADLRIGLMVGLLGGYTTFSSFCLEGVTLFEGGRYLYAVVYLTLSPVLGILATLAGIFLARRF